MLHPVRLFFAKTNAAEGMQTLHIAFFIASLCFKLTGLDDNRR